MKRSYKQYTDEDIIFHAAAVYSIAGLLQKLNLKVAGGNYCNIKRKLHNLNVDTSHWTGKAWCKDKKLKDWANYTQAASIKPHLIGLRSHKCELCQLTTWQNQPIPLELHHVDGDRTNNTLENYQLVCPNCHAMTDNWRGRNAKSAVST